jgi:ATP/ADP translocase
MWFVFGGLAALLYIALIVTLGVSTLRNGHVFMFILGIFLPIFWIIGAIMQPKASGAAQA